MVDRAAPKAIERSAARRYRARHRAQCQQRCGPAATGRFAPSRCVILPATLQRPRPVAEIVCGGEVSWRSSQKEFNAKRCALAAKSVQIANARQPLALTLPLKIIEGFGTSRWQLGY